MKVLLTDDSMTIRMILKNLLKEIGITDVTEGRNGQDALGKLEKEKYDLILIDIHMPKMDGLSVLEEVRTNPESMHKQTPVIIISSDTDYRQIERARDLGAFGYIKKPFKKASLEAAISAAKRADEKQKEEEKAKEAFLEAEAVRVAEVAKEIEKEEITMESLQKESKPPSFAEESSPKKGGLFGWMRKIISSNKK